MRTEIFYPKIYIVILQYNQSEHTLKCLESVAKLHYPNFTVIVVDNGSALEHLKNVDYWIEMHDVTRYTLQATGSNLGYGAGNNVGIKYALEHSADYIFILNNDTVIESDFLDKIPEADISGPIIHSIKWFFPGGIPNGNLDHKDSFISGAAMLVKRKVFEKIGLIDESFFLYFEDADFCFQAKKAGLRLALLEKKIMHHESASVGQMGIAQKLLINVHGAYKFFSRHAPWYVRLLLPLWLPIAILYARIYGNYRDRMRIN